MKKGLSYYLKLNYVTLLKQEKDNEKIYYEAEIPDLPGCGAYGKNKIEALNRLEEAKELWISSRLSRNLPVPEPSSEENFSGRILLRIPARLHMTITSKAKAEALSLNQFIRSKLESGLTLESIQADMSKLKAAVTELCGIISSETSQSYERIESQFINKDSALDAEGIHFIPISQRATPESTGTEH